MHTNSANLALDVTFSNRFVGQLMYPVCRSTESRTSAVRVPAA